MFTLEEFENIQRLGIDYNYLKVLFPKDIFKKAIANGSYIGLSLNGNPNIPRFESDELKEIVESALQNVNQSYSSPTDNSFFLKTFYSSMNIIADAFKLIKDDNLKEKIINRLIEELKKRMV